MVDHGAGNGQVLDDGVLTTLRSALGDDELVADIIGSFLSETPKQIETLAAAGRAGDERAVVAAAHLIKGSALTFGAERLVSHCATLETSPGEAPTLVPAVGQAYDEAARSLSRYLAQLG
jgi:HPt (histidine-containing phosphotransfer) domain-containing protein